ncbi:hypothetical protein J6590_101864, partial [Homalodisca vitripennis]
ELKAILAEAFHHCYGEWEQSFHRCIAAQGTTFKCKRRKAVLDQLTDVQLITTVITAAVTKLRYLAVTVSYLSTAKTHRWAYDT